MPEDIKAVAIPVLGHRLISENSDESQIRFKINGLLDSIPLPTEDWTKA